MERAGRRAVARWGADLAAPLLGKARPLVSGVILTAPGDDLARSSRSSTHSVNRGLPG